MGYGTYLIFVIVVILPMKLDFSLSTNVTFSKDCIFSSKEWKAIWHNTLLVTFFEPMTWYSCVERMVVNLSCNNCKFIKKSFFQHFVPSWRSKNIEFHYWIITHHKISKKCNLESMHFQPKKFTSLVENKVVSINMKGN